MQPISNPEIDVKNVLSQVFQCILPIEKETPPFRPELGT